jgi:hypothetical protein
MKVFPNIFVLNWPCQSWLRKGSFVLVVGMTEKPRIDRRCAVGFSAPRKGRMMDVRESV